MSFRLCSLCEQRKHGKPAGLYNAWFLADEKRVCWRQWVCLECFQAEYVSWLQKCNSDSTEFGTCLGCGGNTKDDLDPVFMTVFLPKTSQLDYELELCASCAALLRVTMQKNAEKMPDRSPNGASGPSPSAPNPWAALGLAP